LLKFRYRWVEVSVFDRSPAKIRRHSCLKRPIHLDGRLSIRCPLASLE